MLKNIMIAMAALLLVAGAGAGGYFYGHGTDDTETATAPAPRAFPNFPAILSMGDDTGADCDLDFMNGAGSCTFADGSRQVLSRGDNAINVHAFGKDDDKGECYTIPLPAASSDASAADTLQNENPADLIRQGKNRKRVKSWIITVPDALNVLAEDGVGLKEIEYFEKDGVAWRAEYKEHGNKKPTMLNLGEGSESVTPSTEQCSTRTADGRALGLMDLPAPSDLGQEIAVGLIGDAAASALCAVPISCIVLGTMALVLTFDEDKWARAFDRFFCTNHPCRRRRQRMLRMSNDAFKTPAAQALFSIGGNIVEFDASRMLASSAAVMVATTAVNAAVESMDTLAPALVTA